MTKPKTTKAVKTVVKYPIVKVPFSNTFIEVCELPSDPRFGRYRDRLRVNVKPICKFLGVDFSSQLHKLKEASWADVVLITMTNSVGKPQEMSCIPLNRVHQWLSSIAVTKVKDTAKRSLITKFQNECGNVLFDYFEGSNADDKFAAAFGHDITPGTSTPELSSTTTSTAVTVAPSDDLLTQMINTLTQVRDQQASNKLQIVEVKDKVAHLNGAVSEAGSKIQVVADTVDEAIGYVFQRYSEHQSSQSLTATAMAELTSRVTKLEVGQIGPVGSKLPNALQMVRHDITHLFDCMARQESNDTKLTGDIGLLRSEIGKLRQLRVDVDELRQAVTEVASQHCVNSGFYALAVYCNIMGHPNDKETLRRIGLRLGFRCRKQGVELRQSVHPQHENVNAYPLHVLLAEYGDTAEVFEERQNSRRR